MKKLLRWVCAILLMNGAVQAEKLVIKGSDTLGAKLVPQLAEAFKAQNPDVTFEIAAEGSTTGIAALTDGTADIGMSSRRVTPAESAAALAKGVNMKPTIVAYDGIEIIVNENNKVASLTTKQVQQIFAGDVVDWSEVGGAPGKINVFTRNTASGTYKDFKQLAMNSRDYVASAQKMAGNEQIVAEVSKSTTGIGYVGLAYGNSPGVRIIPIIGPAGVPLTATHEAVRNRSYPYSRATYFYTNGVPNGLSKKFIDFLFSDAGTEIVEQVGFVPVKGGKGAFTVKTVKATSVPAIPTVIATLPTPTTASVPTPTTALPTPTTALPTPTPVVTPSPEIVTTPVPTSGMSTPMSGQ